jgi:phosphomevalonate kinase
LTTVTTVASAPGKLMLSGEYAVALAGAPAVSTAMDARLTVSLCGVGGGDGWRVTSPALDLTDAPVASVPILAAVVERLASPGATGHFHIESALGAGENKPGLGSSAALAVAAGGALCAHFGLESPGLADLIWSHRRGQGGGSGYDVATALYGGLCRFQRLGDQDLTQPLAWPEGLVARVIHTGRGASTANQLLKLETALAQDPGAVGAALDGHCASAIAAAAAFQDGKGLLEVLSRHEESLRALDRAAELGVMDPNYVGLAGAVLDAGAVLRTAGAGAGDSAWIMGADAAVVEDAVAAAVEAGYAPLDVQVGGPGLKIHGAVP